LNNGNVRPRILKTPEVRSSGFSGRRALSYAFVARRDFRVETETIPPRDTSSAFAPELCHMLASVLLDDGATARAAGRRRRFEIAGVVCLAGYRVA
jgi:hypothetical protein